MNLLALSLLLVPQNPPILTPQSPVNFRIDYGYQTQVASLLVPTTQMSAPEQESLDLVIGGNIMGSTSMAVGSTASGGIQSATFFSSFMIDSDGPSIELSSMYAYAITFDTGGVQGVLHLDFENFDYVYSNRFRLTIPGSIYEFPYGDPLDLRQNYDIDVPPSASNTFTVMFTTEIYIESNSLIPSSPAMATVSFIPNALPVVDNVYSMSSGVAEPYSTNWDRTIDKIILSYTMDPLAVAIGLNAVPTPIGITTSLLYPSPVLWMEPTTSRRLEIPNSALTGLVVYTQPVFYSQNDLITGNVLTLRN